jgi:hypothetical protein
LTITIPSTTPAGNYEVRAVKGDAQSNPVVISVTPGVVIVDIICDAEDGIIIITGSGFSEKPDGTDDYINVMDDGVPLTIISWTDTEIVASGTDCIGTITINTVYSSASSAEVDVCTCYGDINDDSKVDLADLVVVKAEFLREDCGTNPCQADCNGDGKVNLADLVIMKGEFLRTDCCQH